MGLVAKTLLPSPTSRRLARRHGVVPRLRNQCGALLHNEGQCGGPHRGLAQRRDRDEAATERASLPPATRPDPLLIEAAPYSRGDIGGRLALPGGFGCHPVKHSRRPARNPGYATGGRSECPFQADPSSDATLFVECHGGPAGGRGTGCGSIADEYGGGSFRWATEPAERSRVWTAPRCS